MDPAASGVSKNAVMMSALPRPAADSPHLSEPLAETSLFGESIPTRTPRHIGNAQAALYQDNTVQPDRHEMPLITAKMRELFQERVVLANFLEAYELFEPAARKDLLKELRDPFSRALISLEASQCMQTDLAKFSHFLDNSGSQRKHAAKAVEAILCGRELDAKDNLHKYLRHAADDRSLDFKPALALWLTEITVWDDQDVNLLFKLACSRHESPKDIQLRLVCEPIKGPTIDVYTLCAVELPQEDKSFNQFRRRARNGTCGIMYISSDGKPAVRLAEAIEHAYRLLGVRGAVVQPREQGSLVMWEVNFEEVL